MDVLSRTVYENFKIICAIKGKARRKHGKRMACTRIVCMDFLLYGVCGQEHAKTMEHQGR